MNADAADRRGCMLVGIDVGQGMEVSDAGLLFWLQDAP